ncbi:MAG: hypothetical protein K0A98_09965 [Trueperaceae bacterium]|nr:hypothetical protein [Trueperaceae bacterium]
MFPTSTGALAGWPRPIALVAIAFVLMVPLTACSVPLVPRALEVGDALGIDGAQLVGISSLDVPVSHRWRFRVEPPRLWFVDPRDAVAVSVRAGLRTLDVFTCFAHDVATHALPPALLVDGVRWAIQIGFDDASAFKIAIEANPEIVLLADDVREPSGAVRYRPADVEAARRALSFAASVDEFPDAQQWLDRIAPGAPIDVRVHVTLNVAEQADLDGCTIMVAELSSEGATVWMVAGRR